MVRSPRLVRALMLLAALVTLAPGNAAFAQSATASPPAASCSEAPRTLAAVQALNGSAAGSFGVAPNGMPAGSKPDAATAAQIAAVLADYSACEAAKDYPRQLGFFTDNFIEGYIAAAGATAAQVTDQDVQAMLARYTTVITAIRHLRQTAKDRVAFIITTNTRALVYAEMTLVQKRWLIDVVAILPVPADGPAPAFGQTYTDPDIALGFEWDSSWKIVAADKAPIIADFALDNGVSSLTLRWTLLGIESFQKVTTLVQCIAPPSPYAFTAGTVDPASLKIAVDKKKKPQRGVNKTSGFALYTLHYYPLGDFQPGGNNKNRRFIDERLYIECRVLPGKDSFLQISQLVAASDYAAQVKPRQAIEKTIEP